MVGMSPDDIWRGSFSHGFKLVSIMSQAVTNLNAYLDAVESPTSLGEQTRAWNFL